jgi:hypothetical protein
MDQQSDKRKKRVRILLLTSAGFLAMAIGLALFQLPVAPYLGIGSLVALFMAGPVFLWFRVHPHCPACGNRMKKEWHDTGGNHEAWFVCHSCRRYAYTHEVTD